MSSKCFMKTAKLWIQLVLVVAFQACQVTSWFVSNRVTFGARQNIKKEPPFSRWQMTNIEAAYFNSDVIPVIRMDAIACAGLSTVELEVIRTMVEEACLESIGISITCNTTGIHFQEEPCKSPRVIGALGRLLVLHTNLDDDSIEPIEFTIAVHMDRLLYADPPLLSQPLLVKLNNTNRIEYDNNGDLQNYIEHEADMYELSKPLESVICPTIHVELDAAQVTDEASMTTWWDTSTVLVFDDLVDDGLRRRLLNAVLGPGSKYWNDSQNGPDPSRWIRGALMDVSGDGNEDEEIHDHMLCWGLPFDVVDNLCFGRHDAITEFEKILSQKVFPQFHVSRLPEAVFGSCVSPITANAPTYGDNFDFHIDADPYLLPPSPWTDVYGRYPNRLRGKPRFMSCLIYLNDEWDADKWGAPTRFLDLPTNLCYDVSPRPGRCVIMDQDISHTVVPPNVSAGKRPRYSMVWKLVLHPKEEFQDMTDLAVGRNWTDPLYFGSASSQ